MSFSAQWLALREPADHQARDDTLLRRAVAVAGPNPLILDIGSGTGSTVRAMRPHLPRNSRWRLIDHDQQLLQTAATELGEDSTVQVVDISEVDQLPLEGVTMVSASALLDLVSEPWLRTFASVLRVPFYAALSYDGLMEWSPSDSRDADIVHSFNNHQRTDKGFGQALGPDAARMAATIFSELGWSVFHAPSPWRLSADQENLHRELVEGIAGAVAEAGHPLAAAWGQARVSAARESSCVVGHEDLLVIPVGWGSGS